MIFITQLRLVHSTLLHKRMSSALIKQRTAVIPSIQVWITRNSIRGSEKPSLVERRVFISSVDYPVSLFGLSVFLTLVK